MFFYGIGFEKKLVVVSKKICIGKSIGIGFEKNYRYWYLKKMALKKVSDSVSKKNGIGKKFRIRFLLYFGFRHTHGQWAGRWTGGYGCENSNY